MHGYTLFLAFALAVRQARQDHERCLTYVTGKINRKGRMTSRPLKHVKARLNLIEHHMKYTEEIKRYRMETYLNYGSRLR